MLGQPVSDDSAAMACAVQQAALAVAHDDVPVGAVIVRDGVIIAARHNERELTGDPTAHAEVLAIRDAAEFVGHWRLEHCTLYVTLEPCTMCAGALVNARMMRVVFGACDPKAGAAGSLYDVLTDERLNHRCIVEHGLMAPQSSDMLRAFFAERRGAGRSGTGRSGTGRSGAGRSSAATNAVNEPT